MSEYTYTMRLINDKDWTEEEKKIINSRRELISDTVNTVIEERIEAGFPLAFCKEAVRRFDYSMKKKNNKETQIWMNNFTGSQEEDQLNIKKFFDKKLYNTMSFVYNAECNPKENLYQKLKNGNELQQAASVEKDHLKTLKDYSAILSEETSWKCFIQYKDKQSDSYFKSTHRKMDGNIANERAMADMYQYIDKTTEAMDKIKKRKETPYSFYMGADGKRVLNTLKHTREALTEQGFDEELISNTENHMKSVLSEEKYNIFKNFSSSYEPEQAVELAMYKDMFHSINNCQMGKNDELKEYLSNDKNAEKLPVYQAQLLINMKTITEPENQDKTSHFTEFENQESFEEQTTYRMKLMREKDRTTKNQFHFYPTPATEKMTESALKIQKYLGEWSNCTELTSAALPTMPAIHDYDGEKVMFVSKRSWDSYLQNNGNCYATVENYQICDMNKIVVVDEEKCSIIEPQIETIEGKKYWKGFKENRELTKEMNMDNEKKSQPQNEQNVFTEPNTYQEDVPIISDDMLIDMYGDGTITQTDFDLGDFGM